MNIIGGNQGDSLKELRNSEPVSWPWTDKTEASAFLMI